MCSGLSKTHRAWTVLVLVEALLLVFGFCASAWIVKESVILPSELGGDGVARGTVACGPLSFCVTDVNSSSSGPVSSGLNIPTPFLDFPLGSDDAYCASRYGNHFLDLPFVSWVRASVFLLIGGLLWLIVVGMAIGSLHVLAWTRLMRPFAAFATLMLFIGLVLVLDGIKDTALDQDKPAVDQSLCQMCSDAVSFNPGSCQTGWALPTTAVIVLTNVVVVAVGYIVPHTYHDDGKVHPMESDDAVVYPYPSAYA
eukprot:m.85198 g.85198  ORF g.85198 m.85198 type:complete len:254 (+) comp9623_c2_seq1:1926-2687(+)